MKVMSGTGNNLTPKTESGTFCLDLDNSQIDVENELQTFDYNFIGSAENSAAKISLLFTITKKIPDAATECLEKPISESNLPDYTVNGSTEIDTTSSHKSNHNDIAISTELSVNSYSAIKTNGIPLSDKESLKDDSSSIVESPVDQAFSADQSEARAQDTPEKIEYPKTICNHSMETAKAIKKSDSRSESNNELPEKEKSMLLESGKLYEDTTVDVEQDQVQASEEPLDLEDGEVSDDDEEEECPLKVPVCRFYVRNGCSWGDKCRFRHPEPNKKGNYVMFEKKVLPVVSTPFPNVWTSMTPAYQFNLNNVNTDRYYSQDLPVVPKRAALLPTPSFNTTGQTQSHYPKLSDRFSRNLDKPKRIVWQTRLSSRSPSPAKNRSPSVSPLRVEVRVTPTSTLTCKPSVKRYRLPSPPRSSATRCRGPRTPPCSPPIRPSAKLQTAPKRQRLYTYLSTSTGSSELSTSECSEESSSSSDSDEEYRIQSSRRTNKKHSSRASTKSSSRVSTKSRQLDWCTSRRQETSDTRRTSRHTSKSKSRIHSSSTTKYSSTTTPERDLPRVSSNVVGKPPYKGGSCPGRREYLLMKLLQVEEQIAKKKKKMKMKC